ncbi:trypsin-like peptidase domain-containing protein [uncultured Thiodictyon sp.]|uniref:trypsin-like peptidase domain-containing protein n=1 Tax=uncultured Thiodictyon sp. TaxID=1846217 RepID=UPI0025F7963C|nr:trypsin-like peptidase domain-containing protein [uncultured Thiodictyon sp.]
MTHSTRVTISRQHSRPAAVILAALTLWFGGVGGACGEVYKSLDADGRWQFTDRPPPGSVPLPAAQPAAASHAPEVAVVDRDLAARLDPQQTATPIAHCRLAAVKIETWIGSGSGFFVTGDGLILTNRHVVRPPKDWRKQVDQRMEKAGELLAEVQRQLVTHSRRGNPAMYDRIAKWEQEASARYGEARHELDRLNSRLASANSFKIELKDGTKLTAELVGLSERQDLALLRLKGYNTPFIAPLNERGLRDAEKVYVIGSPLGKLDQISSGDYTGDVQGLLATNAKVQPGNSGGPMVTEDGKVVGIVTIKLSANADPEVDSGLGFAIPIKTALEEFSELRKGQ